MSWKWLLKMDISTSTAYKREFQKIGGSFKQLADTFNLDSGARKCGIDSILTNVINSDEKNKDDRNSLY